MNVLITGAFGFLGRKLVGKLLERGELLDGTGKLQTIGRIVLSDIDAAARPALDDPRLQVVCGDLGDASFVEKLVTSDLSAVFHLGSLVSGGAEQDFSLGMSANFLGTWHVLEACRKSGATPRLVFTSSVAAYGGKLPSIITDDQRLTPQSSYGAQKAIGELLVAEYTRKGYIDGRSVRLPIIAIRPGKANTATSSWASAIIREPLAGEPYVCPLDPSDTAFLLSPGMAIKGLVLAVESDPHFWGDDRAVMMAGLACTPRDLVDALARIAGPEVAARVQWGDDRIIRAIVNSWPSNFSLEKASLIGFRADPSIDSIIQDYISTDAT